MSVFAQNCYIFSKGVITIINLKELKLKADEKTKKAYKKLSLIFHENFKKFFNIDLEILRRKSTVQEIVDYVENENRSVYKYAERLSDKGPRDDFIEAIEWLSKPPETKKTGRFYTLVVQNRKKLSESRADIEKFLQVTTDKDTEGDDVKKHSNDKNILKKLKKDNLASILKGFIALVALDYCTIVEDESECKDDVENALQEWKEYESGWGNGEEKTVITPEAEQEKREALMKHAREKIAERKRRKIEERIIKENADKGIILYDDYIKRFKEFYDVDFSDSEESMIKLVRLGFSIFDKRDLEMIRSEIEKFKGESKECAKKIYGELLWIHYHSQASQKIRLRYIEFGNIVIFFTLISRLAEHKCCDNGQLYLILGQLDDMTDDYNKSIKEIIDALGELNYRLARCDGSVSLYKIETAHKKLTKLRDELKTLKTTDATIQNLAEGIEVLCLEPNIAWFAKRIEDKKNELPKSRSVFAKGFGPLPYGSSEDGRYIPHYYTENSVKQVGAGGFGVVKVYLDTEDNNKKVAIKTLNEDGAFKPDKIEKLKRIDSPYVAKLYGLTTLIFNSGTKEVGLVMEYVHGASRFIDEVYSLSKTEVLDICKQIVEAIQAFDVAGFHHVDLNHHFNNILIGKEGKIKIIDYEDAEDKKIGQNETEALQNVLDVLKRYGRGMDDKFLGKYSGLKFKCQWGKHVILPGQTIPGFDKLLKDLEDLKKEI